MCIQHFHYLGPVPGPSPVAPLPPGESSREILRRWEVRKPDAIRPIGVPTGSAVHRRTVERSWLWREVEGYVQEHLLCLFVCVCVCMCDHSHQAWPCAGPRRSVFPVRCHKRQLQRADSSWTLSSWWRQMHTAHGSLQTDLEKHTHTQNQVKIWQLLIQREREGKSVSLCVVPAGLHTTGAISSRGCSMLNTVGRGSL